MRFTGWTLYWIHPKQKWARARRDKATNCDLNVKSCFARKHYFIFWSLTNVNVMIFTAHYIHWSAPNRYLFIVFTRRRRKKTFNISRLRCLCGGFLPATRHTLAGYIVANYYYFFAYPFPLFSSAPFLPLQWTASIRSTQARLRVCGCLILCYVFLFLCVRILSSFMAIKRQFIIMYLSSTVAGRRAMPIFS